MSGKTTKKDSAMREPTNQEALELCTYLSHVLLDRFISEHVEGDLEPFELRNAALELADAARSLSSHMHSSD